MDSLFSSFVTIGNVWLMKVVDTGDRTLDLAIVTFTVTLINLLYDQKFPYLFPKLISMYHTLKMKIVGDDSYGLHITDNLFSSLYYQRVIYFASDIDENERKKSIPGYHSSDYFCSDDEASMIEEHLEKIKRPSFKWSEYMLKGYDFYGGNNDLVAHIVPVHVDKLGIVQFYDNTEGQRICGNHHERVLAKLKNDDEKMESICMKYYTNIKDEMDVLTYHVIKNEMNFDKLLFEEKEKTIETLEKFKSGRVYDGFMPNNVGFLLYGPPGTGKTSFVTCIAKYLKRDVSVVDLRSIKTIKMFYDAMSKVKNDVIVFDEFDFVILDLINRKTIRKSGGELLRRGDRAQRSTTGSTDIRFEQYKR
jgi:DNA replication protein DnaC